MGPLVCLGCGDKDRKAGDADADDGAPPDQQDLETDPAGDDGVQPEQPDQPEVPPDGDVPVEGCDPGQFECDDGTCIDAGLLCDGTDDCSDGFDEDCF